MRLHYSPNSPYARKVVVALAETGQTNDVEIVEASTGPLNAQAMPATLNPLGKIPALERADGAALYDSRVICRYVDSRAGGVLYPAAPRLWDTLTIEATADGIMDAALLMVYESRVRPEDKRFDGWLEGQWAVASCFRFARGDESFLLHAADHDAPPLQGDLGVHQRGIQRGCGWHPSDQSRFWER